ncbi:MAG: glycerate kinase [Armatimonadetes bacterium]|nr:glycerate kinase [Armatimonadota bacterium]
MRILICPNAFKGSLSASQAAVTISDAVADVIPDAELDICPLADGGDGTLETLVTATGGTVNSAPVHDALMRPIQAEWGLLGDRRTAVIEMARAAGLTQLNPAELAPDKATTFGVGELIKHVAATGCSRMIIGIGGSATNDGGSGALTALGARFLDGDGGVLQHGGLALNNLADVDISGLEAYRRLKLMVACDVTNPLLGAEGASAVYGPQKGAGPNMVKKLESALQRFSEITARITGFNLASMPGAGAAGGLGAGLAAYLGASLEPGWWIVARAVQLEERMTKCDLIITGEGKIDLQSGSGKVVGAVGQLAIAAGRPVVALCGVVDVDLETLNRWGVTAAFSIIHGPSSLPEAIANAEKLLFGASKNVAQALRLGYKIGRSLENPLL